MESYPIFMYLSIVKNGNNPKLLYKFEVTPIKISVYFFEKIETLILKFKQRCREPRLAICCGKREVKLEKSSFLHCQTPKCRCYLGISELPRTPWAPLLSGVLPHQAGEHLYLTSSIYQLDQLDPTSSSTEWVSVPCQPM